MLSIYLATSIVLAQPVQVSGDLKDLESLQKTPQDIDYKDVMSKILTERYVPSVANSYFDSNAKSLTYIIELKFSPSSQLSSTFNKLFEDVSTNAGYKVCFPDLGDGYSISMSETNLNTFFGAFGFKTKDFEAVKLSQGTVNFKTTLTTKNVQSAEIVYFSEEQTGEVLYSAIREEIENKAKSVTLELFPMPERKPISLKIKTSDDKEIQIPVEMSSNYKQDLIISPDTTWRIKGTNTVIPINKDKATHLQLINLYLKHGQVELTDLQNIDYLPSMSYELFENPIKTEAHFSGDNNAYYDGIRHGITPKLDFSLADGNDSCIYNVSTFPSIKKVEKISVTTFDKDTWKKISDIKFTNPAKVEVVQEYLYPPKKQEWTSSDEDSAIAQFDERIFREAECNKLANNNIVRSVELCKVSYEYKSDGAKILGKDWYNPTERSNEIAGISEKASKTRIKPAPQIISSNLSATQHIKVAEKIKTPKEDEIEQLEQVQQESFEEEPVQQEAQPVNKGVLIRLALLLLIPILM